MTGLILLRPYALLLAIPLGCIAALIWFKPKQHHQWRGIVDESLLAFLLPQSQSQQRKFILGAIVFAWVLALCALIGPSLHKTILTQEKQLTPRVILFDLSSHMNKTDVAPSRLERAKFKVSDLLTLDREAETALVAFTGEPFLVTPFTEDRQTITNLLQRLHPGLMPVDGSHLTHAMQFAKKLFEKNHMQQGEVIIVTSSIPNQKDFDTATLLAHQGIHVNVLGIGTETQLPGKALATLAHSGQGQYRMLDITNKDIQALVSTTGKKDLVQRNQQGYQPHDDGYYLLFAIMLCVLFGFRQGLFEQLTR